MVRSSRDLVLLLAGGVSLLTLGMPAAQAQSLNEALASAYDSNPQLLAERAQLRVTDESVPKALSGWRPTVQVTADTGESRSVIESEAGIDTNNPRPNYQAPYEYGLSVAQPLYEGGRTTAQTHEALHQVSAEQAHLTSIEQSVLLAAVTDYLNVVEAQATLNLTISNQHVFEKQREATIDRFQVGEVTRTDVAQSDSALAQAIAQREQADGDLQVDRAAYQRDIGSAPGLLTAPAGNLDLPAAKDAALALAASANPDVASAQFNQAAAEDDVKVVRSQLLPSLSLDASVARTNDVELQSLRYNSESVTAQLTVPLYESGSVYSDTRAAKQTVGVRISQFDQARLQATEAASAAWEQLAEASANVTSFESQIKANILALQGVQQESSVGERTVLDVLNAEQALFQSKVSLVQAQHDELLAKYSLLDAVGGLTAKALGLSVTIYDPETHLKAVRDKWIGTGTSP